MESSTSTCGNLQLEVVELVVPQEREEQEVLVEQVVPVEQVELVELVEQEVPVDLAGRSE